MHNSGNIPEKKGWKAHHSSASGQDGITEAGFTLQYGKAKEKLDKIYETVVSRHWTSSNEWQWPLRHGKQSK